MHILLVSIGSHGDITPFLGLGVAMKQRGHKATIVANPHFETIVGREGLGFAAMGVHEDYEQLAQLFSTPQPPLRTIPIIARHFLLAMRSGYKRIEELHEKGETIVVGHIGAFATLLAKDRLRLPTITLLVNPTLLPSVYSPAKMSSLLLPPLPASIAKRVLPPLMRVVERELAKAYVPEINKYREDLGLGAISNFRDWLNSADILIGGWPEWLYGKQPDWPSNAITTEFLDYSPTPTLREAQCCEDVVNMLNVQKPPIIFSIGSAMSQAADYFEAAAESCSILSHPGILLTQHSEQIPTPLPRHVHHLSYAPLAALASKAAAIVHHGGFGTASTTLRAGIPQLIVPMVFDQFDNAQRLSRLGVAKSISRKDVSARFMAKILRQLVESRSIADCCRYYSDKMRQTDPFHATCQLAERLHHPSASDHFGVGVRSTGDTLDKTPSQRTL